VRSKAFVRRYNFELAPLSWTNRQHGVSKLGLQEMGVDTRSSSSTFASRLISFEAIPATRTYRRMLGSSWNFGGGPRGG
jgi:hypothetical protein